MFLNKLENNEARKEMRGGLAPIGLSTYGRLKHLQRSIDALKNNELASESDLYLFSDAPKPGDEERVTKLRMYLRTINGFKKVHIVERETNNRVANSRGGLEMLLNNFGKVIFLAEDIITAPEFLTFMNQALEKYEFNKQIFSITGYCPPISIPADYKQDLFLLKRFNAWGLGLWKDRYDSIKYLTPKEFEEFVKDKNRLKDFEFSGGSDMTTMLRRDAYSEIDALDVKAMYAQFLSNQYTLYPTQSLIRNIGMDGTGVHCPDTKMFDVTLSDKKIQNFPDQFVIDRRILKANFKFRQSLRPEETFVGALKLKFSGYKAFVRHLLIRASHKIKNTIKN